MRDSKTVKLLLVEDSLEDEQLLSEALLEIEENRLWCHWLFSSVVPVDRLSEALNCLQRDSFDAILLNLSLPDSPTLLACFLEVSACAGCAPILVLADQPDDHLANRLLREGAQDFLVKSEIDCALLARAVRYAIERQRRAGAIRAAAFVDPLTGLLSREAFLNVARYRGREELLALAEIPADRETLDPLLLQAADALRRVFEPSDVLGRWDQRRLCVLASRAALHRATQLANGALQLSIASLEELQDAGELPERAKIAMLAD